MCVECITITVSPVPNGAYATAQLAEDRHLGQSVGGVGATLPIAVTTTVVLEGVWKIPQQTILTRADAAFLRVYGRS